MGDIRDFGARGDQVHDDGPAIQRAIDHTAKSGGGTVVVPPGRWSCRQLRLASRIHLCLEPGATVVAASDDEHCRSLIIAEECDDVMISGGGTLAGNGQRWRSPASPGQPWQHPLSDSPGYLLELRRCQRVRVSDIQCSDAPHAAIHAHGCEVLWLERLAIRNAHRACSNGVVIDGCRSLQMHHCSITGGLHGIYCLSSDRSGPCEDLTISGIQLQLSGSAIRLGPDNCHPIRRVTIAHITIAAANRGLAIHGYDGGTIEQVRVNTVIYNDDRELACNLPLHIDVRPRDEQGRGTVVSGLSVSDFIASGCGRMLLTCAEGCSLNSVSLSAIHFHYHALEDPAPPFASFTDDTTSAWHSDAREARAAIIADGVDDLQLREVMLRWPSDANTSTGHGRRWEAGGHGQHTYAADAPSPPWAVLWGRGLVGGWLDIGNLRASDTSIPAIDVAMSARTILVVEDSGNEELDHDE